MNTDELSLERINHKKIIGQFYFGDVKQNKPKLLKFLTELPDEIAGLEFVGGEDIESDSSYITSSYIIAFKWQLESDEEYITRLQWKISLMIKSKKNWEDKRKFYESGETESKCKELEDIITNIKKTQPDCH